MGTLWLVMGRNSLYVLSESPGYFRKSQLALLVYTHFLNIQIVLINCPFKQNKT